MGWNHQLDHLESNFKKLLLDAKKTTFHLSFSPCLHWEVVKPFGYELLQVELYDAIWIRKEYMDAFRGGRDGSQCKETAERCDKILIFWFFLSFNVQ